jgi:hypothetical protein
MIGEQAKEGKIDNEESRGNNQVTAYYYTAPIIYATHVLCSRRSINIPTGLGYSFKAC